MEIKRNDTRVHYKNIKPKQTFIDAEQRQGLPYVWYKCEPQQVGDKTLHPALNLATGILAEHEPTKVYVVVESKLLFSG